MKASNPKVMIQAYRLLTERMAQEGPISHRYDGEADLPERASISSRGSGCIRWSTNVR